MLWAWLWAALFGMVSPTDSRAHGSLAISQAILWRGDTMLVSADSWGLFVGTEGGPWRWICEEAINANSSRQIVLISDGTLFATDRTGLSVSRDNGCSWSAVQGAIAELPIVALHADRSRPRAWALAYSSDVGKVGLYASDDQGASFQLAYAMPDHLPNGLYVSDDGVTLAVSSLTSLAPRQPVLHVSSDGGMTFTPRVVSYQLDGQPLMAVTPTWIDPRMPSQIYLQAPASNGTVLLRSDGTASPVEVLRTLGGITGMAIGQASDQLIVGSGQGLYASSSGGPFLTYGMFTSVQCLSPHNGSLYACAWNYPPDEAAVARITDGTGAFSRVLEFSATTGPLDCPASTPVAQICPGIWQSYAYQLGVQLNPPDGGMEAPLDTMPSGCAVLGRRGQQRAAQELLFLLLALTLLAAGARAHRRLST